METLPKWLAGGITPQPQDESQASWTKIIKKEDGLINWNKSAEKIERQIRAHQPWPGAYSEVKSTKYEVKNKIKISQAETTENDDIKKTGEVFLTKNNELAIQAGQDALLLKKLQLAGGKPMNAQDFLRGHRDIIGKILN